MLQGLLCVPRAERLACGGGGLSELQAHPFFAGKLDWDAVYRKEVTAPLSPFTLSGSHSAGPGGGGTEGVPSAMQRQGSREELDKLESEFEQWTSCRDESPGPLEASPYSQLCAGEAHGAVRPPPLSVATSPVVRVRRGSDPYTCPLTERRFRDPVVAADGFTYERAGLEAWVLEHGQVSPTTGTQMSAVMLANRTLMEGMEASHTRATPDGQVATDGPPSPADCGAPLSLRRLSLSSSPRKYRYRFRSFSGTIPNPRENCTPVFQRRRRAHSDKQ